MKNINVGFDQETLVLLKRLGIENRNKFIRDAVREKARKEMEEKRAAAREMDLKLIADAIGSWFPTAKDLKAGVISIHNTAALIEYGLLPFAGKPDMVRLSQLVASEKIQEQMKKAYAMLMRRKRSRAAEPRYKLQSFWNSLQAKILSNIFLQLSTAAPERYMSHSQNVLLMQQVKKMLSLLGFSQACQV